MYDFNYLMGSHSRFIINVEYYSHQSLKLIIKTRLMYSRVQILYREMHPLPFTIQETKRNEIISDYNTHKSILGMVTNPV